MSQSIPIGGDMFPSTPIMSAKFNRFDDEILEKYFTEEAIAQYKDLIRQAQIETLRSIDCIVYDPIDLEKYLDERIKELKGEQDG